MNALSLIAFSPFDPMHMLVIGVVALLLFGKRLPEVGRSLGRGIAEFKKGLKDVSDELNRSEPQEPQPRLREPEDHVATSSRLPGGEQEPPK
jgi:sec-independent protein translocase protein TatA